MPLPSLLLTCSASTALHIWDLDLEKAPRGCRAAAAGWGWAELLGPGSVQSLAGMLRGQGCSEEGAGSQRGRVAPAEGIKERES